MAEASNQTVEAPYKVYGTNEPYNGLTVEVGGFLYTTVGGALEGNSLQLTANVQPQQTQPTPPNGNGNNFVYLEDYDIGTGDGILKVNDASYWVSVNRSDIAQQVTNFITTGNMPPNRPTQGVQGGQAGNNQVGGSPSNNNQAPNTQTGGGGGMY